MTQDEIVKMAREAGAYCQHGDFNMGHSYEFQPDQLERFASLVAAAEREACAKLLDDWKKHNWTFDDCAAVIRAREKNI